MKSTQFFGEKNLKNAPLPADIGITFASYIKNEFGTLEQFLKGIQAVIRQQIEGISEEWPFREESKAAKNIGIKFPIIQGPMANISDNVEFAKQVASNGALPIIALGGLMKDEAEDLFVSIADEFESDYVYGGGIIGLEIMKERREDHISLLQKYETPICLLAAGTVQLASRIKC